MGVACGKGSSLLEVGWRSRTKGKERSGGGEEERKEEVKMKEHQRKGHRMMSRDTHVPGLHGT